MVDFSHAFYEHMSNTLLAKQPITDKKYIQNTQEDWDVTYEQLESGLGSDRVWRYSPWAYWSVIARYILPRRYHWLIVANKMTRGGPINDSIIDSTGTDRKSTRLNSS